MLGIRDTKRWPKQLRECFEDEFGGPDELARCWSESIAGTRTLAQSSNDGDFCSHLLPLIRCPTLLVHGTADPIVTTDAQREILDKIPIAELHQIPGGGHNVHILAADVFNRLIADFLQRTN